MLEYRVRADRADARGSVATTKEAEIILDIAPDGLPDAFNPAELFLAAISACMIKGIEHVSPMLDLKLRGVEVRLHAVRQDSAPKIVSVDYELIVDTDENDLSLGLLHMNVGKYGMIPNTAAAATKLEGVIRRADGGAAWPSRLLVLLPGGRPAASRCTRADTQRNSAGRQRRTLPPLESHAADMRRDAETIIERDSNVRTSRDVQRPSHDAEPRRH